MHFDLTADQVAMRDTMRQLCRDRFPMPVVRGTATAGLDRDRWGELAALGLFGLRVPEADGGVGLGWPDAAVLFEELGRALVPGPLVASHLAAGLVPGALEGTAVVGMVERGIPVLVEHLDALDALVVVGGDGLALVAPGDLAARPIGRPTDPLTPLHLVEALPAGQPLGDAAVARDWRRGAALLVSAIEVGLAAAVLDLGVEHARSREQFQRPIGSFQAVKHQLADSLVRLDLAQAAVHAAAVVLEDADADDDVERALSVAKLTAGEAALENAKTSVQVHGAMGFTWEVDVHLYLKRAWVHDAQLGSVQEHANRLAAILAASAPASAAG
jgi:alkylation response protein AidB-like acyl-CoA dehydrogenase